MNIEKLSIDKFPTISEEIISVEHSIDADEEISITINNKEILDKDYIYSIWENKIELIPDIKIYNKDSVVVVYYKI